ncbi:MAG: amidohydrolase family protein [Bdellovibrio sp.]|nr:amidohydrolase family protein [Bdellovibrio sp.]
MGLVIKNGTYVDWETLEVKCFDIKLDNADNSNQVIDAAGKFVMRSFACAHHHAYSFLARGMPAPKQTPSNFHEILKYIWWNLDRKLDLEMIKASARGTALLCAKNGVTFVIDHHSSPMASSGSLEIISQAFKELGVGHLLCLELSDRDGAAALKMGFDETETFLKTNPDNGLIGLHASFTLNAKTLEKTAVLMEKYNTGVHVHVAEDIIDQSECEKKYHLRVLERFQKYGFLNSSKTILAHGVHLSEHERELFTATQAFLAISTESNQNNRVGVFSSRGLPCERIMLGTDGMHSDMLQSARAHYLQNHHTENIDLMTAYKRLRNIHSYLTKNKIPGDDASNLVIYDYPAPTTVHTGNFLGHFFYGIMSADVDTVISNGKVIIKNKKHTLVDEHQILAHCKEQGERLWKEL